TGGHLGGIEAPTPPRTSQPAWDLSATFGLGARIACALRLGQDFPERFHIASVALRGLRHHDARLTLPMQAQLDPDRSSDGVANVLVNNRTGGIWLRATWPLGDRAACILSRLINGDDIGGETRLAGQHFAFHERRNSLFVTAGCSQ